MNTLNTFISVSISSRSIHLFYVSSNLYKCGTKTNSPSTSKRSPRGEGVSFEETGEIKNPRCVFQGVEGHFVVVMIHDPLITGPLSQFHEILLSTQ